MNQNFTVVDDSLVYLLSSQ